MTTVPNKSERINWEDSTPEYDEEETTLEFGGPKPRTKAGGQVAKTPTSDDYGLDEAEWFWPKVI